MSLIPLSGDNFENYVIRTHTHRSFSSSSTGLIGEIKVFPRASDIEKDTVPPGDNAQSPAGKFSLEELHNKLVGQVYSTPSVSNIKDDVEEYINTINSKEASVTRQKRVGVIRFEPSFRFTKDTGRKNTIKQILFPYYSNKIKSCEWAYTNYHTINFFTSSDVPSTSVLIYPAASGTLRPMKESYGPDPDAFPYTPHDAFTFSFWINPRYTTDVSGLDYKAGTILHLSSSYAISLVTGSSRDINGKPDAFRIVVQLRESTGIPPSAIDIDNPLNTDYFDVPSDLIFVSSDNSLKRNHWHHVAVRWGGPSVNAGTGSFVIDGMQDTRFCIPSASIMPTSFSPGPDPDCLFVGNFLEQKSTSLIPARFFNANVAYTDGLISFFPGTPYNPGTGDADNTDPNSIEFGFEHPLNAEIHEIKIYRSYKSIPEIVTGSLRGISSIPDDLLFYLPPYFTKDTSERNVLQTPFQSVRSTTNDPFNVALSFGIGGHEINLPNFLREFVQGTYPRLYHLTASEIEYAVGDPRSANDLLYDNPGLRKGNLTILPNDNGQFYPNFDILSTDGISSDRFLDRFGNIDYSLIGLEDMVDMSNIALGTSTDDDTGGYVIGSVATPEDPGLAEGNVLTVLNRTRDPSSNEVVFFDASNLYYGNSIKRNSYKLFDSALTGSGQKVSISINDNGRGGLHRSDCLTAQADWNELGTILYDEGIAVIKSPNVSIFGKDHWSLEFDGDYNVHVLEIGIPCAKGNFNSSSNPNWKQLLPSDNANSVEKEFCYITGLNLHDENFNVVARMNLAQPVVKKESDRFLFRVKIDF